MSQNDGALLCDKLLEAVLCKTTFNTHHGVKLKNIFSVNLFEPEDICTVASASVRDRYLIHQNIKALKLSSELSIMVSDHWRDYL